MTGLFVAFGKRAGRAGFSGYVPTADGCWIWAGAIRKKGLGYGSAWSNGRVMLAHRAVWESINGPIPAGMELDHFLMPERCDYACVNPAHLRPVSHRENTLRADNVCSRELAQTHCRWGHPLSGDNLRKSEVAAGRRQCRTCANRRFRIGRAKRKAMRALLTEADA